MRLLFFMDIPVVQGIFTIFSHYLFIFTSNLAMLGRQYELSINISNLYLSTMKKGLEPIILPPLALAGTPV